MYLYQYKNSRGEEFLVVIDERWSRNWSLDQLCDYFVHKGLELRGCSYIRGIKLFDGDLYVKPGDWWRKA